MFWKLGCLLFFLFGIVPPFGAFGCVVGHASELIFRVDLLGCMRESFDQGGLWCGR